MASFDIVSLFTNVPLKETIDIILNKVYDCKLIQTKIPRKDLEILLYCCTRESSFVFNNEYYSQIDGTAMGSPLGPTLAGICIASFKDMIMKNNVTKFNELLCWYR
jgi:hypothetical protein